MTDPSTDSRIADFVAAIDGKFRANPDLARAASEKRYLKSDLEFIGANVGSLRKLTRELFKANPWLDADSLPLLVQALWRHPIHEYRSVAIELLLFRQQWLTPAGLPLLEQMLREAKTWAYVDAIAIHVVGPLIERHPELATTLDRWSIDADFWLRRSAMLALQLPMRRGAGDFERFVRYADAMLEEREFFIRKAIGWTLREVSKKRPALVYDWLQPRTYRASGVTIREAVKYLPTNQQASLMAAYRVGAGSATREKATTA